MPNVLFYNTESYTFKYFNEAANLDSNKNKLLKLNINIKYIKETLNHDTAILAKDYDIVGVFVNDNLDKKTIDLLSSYNIKLILLRCAGFNNIDIKAAEEAGIVILRVPEYSPYAVAELAVALILSINRKIHKAYNRTREGNFTLNGLVGFDMHGKTVGIIGTGKIGVNTAKILAGFGMNILGYDLYQNPEAKDAGVKYTDLNKLLKQSDIISLHCPLTPKTKYIINSKAIKLLKPNCIIINTSRGALVDTLAITEALKNKQISGFGLDVYEHESDLFFRDLSDEIIADDTIARLVTYPNVVLTAHQGFLTQEALNNIAKITINNIIDFIENNYDNSKNLVTSKLFN